MGAMEVLDRLSGLFVLSTIAGSGFMLGGLIVCKLLGKSPVNVTANVYTYRHGGSETHSAPEHEKAGRS